MKSVKKVMASVVAVIGCVAFATSAFAWNEAEQFVKDKETIATYLTWFNLSQGDANALVSVLSENNVAKMKARIPAMKQKATDAQASVMANPANAAEILKGAASGLNVTILCRVTGCTVDTDNGQVTIQGYVQGERGVSPIVTTVQPLASVSTVATTYSVAQDPELAAAVASNPVAVSALAHSNATVR